MEAKLGLSIIPLLFSYLWLAIVIVYTVALATLLATTKTRIETGGEHEDFPSVSLVIPTYNEARIINRKMENILQLDYPKDKLGVLVVDSGSTDATREIVRAFARNNEKRLNVILLGQPTRQGKSAAINEALRYSNAEVFALTDADIVVGPHALKSLVRHLRDDTVGGVSGVEVPVGGQNLLFQVEVGYRSIYTAVRMAEAAVDTPFMCESEFSAFSRDSLELLKPGCMCDDLELTVTLRSRGRRAVYALGVPFFEQEASVFKPKLRHKYRRGMANQHGIIRNRRVLFNKTFGRYGSVVFPFEFFVHILSPFMLLAAFALFTGTIFTAPFDVPMEAVFAVATGAPALVLLRRLTRKYVGTEISNTRRPLSWFLGAISFLGFQMVLAASLAHLALRGPKLQWSQISETRSPIQGVIQVPSR
ncbi:MAG TPA: glycosyltransferase [Candidatus Angelobacter sp.]|nr:glycosyltransferase [Candidatus Angelobacter sp.]